MVNGDQLALAKEILAEVHSGGDLHTLQDRYKVIKSQGAACGMTFERLTLLLLLKSVGEEDRSVSSALENLIANRDGIHEDLIFTSIASLSSQDSPGLEKENGEAHEEEGEADGHGAEKSVKPEDWAAVEPELPKISPQAIEGGPDKSEAETLGESEKAAADKDKTKISEEPEKAATERRQQPTKMRRGFQKSQRRQQPTRLRQRNWGSQRKQQPTRTRRRK